MVRRLADCRLFPATRGIPWRRSRSSLKDGHQRIACYCSGAGGTSPIIDGHPSAIRNPRSVAAELLRAPEDDPARRAIVGNIFKIIETPAPPAQIPAWDLSEGETAVLSYALARPKWIAVLDDGTARRCARSPSVIITGTLAVVLLAKQYGLINLIFHLQLTSGPLKDF